MFVNKIPKIDAVMPYSAYYFAIWRICFGFFLFFYSCALLPYVEFLYSNSGLYASYDVLPYFPSILAINDSSAMVYAISIVSVVCSFGILIGYKRVYCAFILWFILATLFGRNYLVADPSAGFVSMAILLLALVPEGEPLSIHATYESIQKWYMPTYVYYTLLVAIGLGYTISGFDKFSGTGWAAGDAMKYLYNFPFTYETWFVSLLQSLPAWLISLQTWAAALSMVLALPLLLIRKSRPYMWLVLTVMFIFVGFVLDIKQVVFGVLLTHLFFFDNQWISPKKISSVKLFYDTKCNLCNGYRHFIETEDVRKITTFASVVDAPKNNSIQSDSIVLEADGKVYYKSDAVLRHLQILGGVWRLFGTLGLIIPLRLRNAVYDYVGRHRYAWFGACDCSV